jgi:hypothetical protein
LIIEVVMMQKSIPAITIFQLGAFVVIAILSNKFGKYIIVNPPMLDKS